MHLRRPDGKLCLQFDPSLSSCCPRILPIPRHYEITSLSVNPLFILRKMSLCICPCSSVIIPTFTLVAIMLSVLGQCIVVLRMHCNLITIISQLDIMDVHLPWWFQASILRGTTI